MSTALGSAYVSCQQITRTQARNFYYGIRLLPATQRRALCAVYALARRIDDIGDGDLPLAEKRGELSALRTSLREQSPGDPVIVAVHDAARRFPIPLDAFDDLSEGVLMDLDGRRYESFDELVDYCRHVAGSIGRLCLGVFGSRPDAQAPGYADSLGVALQQTNILRDVREDLLHGRVYLPAEDLERFGVALAVDDHGVLVDEDGRLAQLIRFSAARAETWYDDGRRLLPLLDRRSAACAYAMSEIYRRLLERIRMQPQTTYDRRLSLTGWEKAGVAARALTGTAA